MSKEGSFILFDMLTTNPIPSWFNIKDKNGNKIKVAWKTGTSYCFKDAWSVGIFGDYVLVVWVGNFSGDTKTNETLFITATSGKHEVKAIDDLNRYSSSVFNVEYHIFRD